NTLIGIERPEAQGKLFANPKVDRLKAELTLIRHRMFTAKTTGTKNDLRKKDAALRLALAEEVEKAFRKANEDETRCSEEALVKATKELEEQQAKPVEWQITRMTNLFGEVEEMRVDLTKETRHRLRDSVKNLEARRRQATQLEEELDGTAKQLAAWDPYDQNEASPFFDAEWMFGVRDGFDVVIGNPPYGFRKIHSDFSKDYFRTHFVVAHGSFEHHFLFYEASLKMLAKQGCLAFIAPVTWLTIPSAQALRKFVLVDYAVTEIALFSDEVFSNASVNTIVSFIRRANRGDTWVKFFADLKSLPAFPNIDRHFQQQTFIDGGYYFSIFSTTGDAAIIEKIRRNSIPLAEIATPCSGYNPYEVGAGLAPDGGVQTKETVKEKPYHSARKHGKEWKAEIVGRDLQRYRVNATGQRWVRYGPWLAAPRDPTNFKGERILVQEITGGEDRRIVAAYNDGELYHSRDVIPIRLTRHDPHPFYLLGIINSWLISWYHQRCNPKAQKGLFPKVLVSDLAKLPLRIVPGESHDLMVRLVTRILAAKAADPTADTSALEREIDERVYQLYGLTEDEIRVVEGGQ
ncbi:MAG: TaqI-like C-terminal specificity domain-containing protein, partial [Synergistaceae bacterium]|nr:TaqI-like C-terminal specificity domain-containing protein [Synergistaceae bacterium]